MGLSEASDLKSIGTTWIAAFCLAGSAFAREEISLTEGWRFTKGDVPEAARAEFDDSGWTSISLPHTWNNLDGQDGGGNYYRGPGWYRKRFGVDPNLAGKSLFLRFEGANRNTEVFVNGQRIGSHKGGHAAFCFEVTSAVKSGDGNQIAVRVDNAHDPESPPLAADFTFCGGLYREVKLLALDQLSISPLDFAAPGVYLKQLQVTEAAAEIEATVKLRNGGIAKEATVRITLTDRDGKTVQTVSTKQTVPAKGVADSVQKLALASPHLWNGRADPYLYTATVEVFDGTQLVDRLTQPLGLRFFHIDPEKGFFLNGKSLDLHGVNRHQDRLDKGWAIGSAEHAEDFALIQEMGCTAVRLAHYQHAQEFYDLCDTGGLVVWAEMPMVNGVTESEAFLANARQQMTELIKQNFNHPSIVFWSCYNELENGFKSTNNWAIVKDINQVAKDLDPTRFTAGATHVRHDHPMHFWTDVVGFNKYFGWYYGQVGDFGPWLDKVHTELPSLRFSLTEYGVGANPFQHELHPTKRPPASPWHPEELQCLFHEAYWQELAKRPFVWGKYVWVMFDFASDGRNEGSAPGQNDKGLVSADRKIMKDAFYFYKANWTQEPLVYLTSRRFAIRNKPETEVKVYSNCDSVELRLNGESKGIRKASNHVFLWEDLKLKNGENQVEAIGTKGETTVRDHCGFTFDPSAAIPMPPPLPSR